MGFSSSERLFGVLQVQRFSCLFAKTRCFYDGQIWFRSCPLVTRSYKKLQVRAYARIQQRNDTQAHTIPHGLTDQCCTTAAEKVSECSQPVHPPVENRCRTICMLCHGTTFEVALIGFRASQPVTLKPLPSYPTARPPEPVRKTSPFA